MSQKINWQNLALHSAAFVLYALIAVVVVTENVIAIFSEDKWN